jgi:hypothetical protein
MPVHVPDGCNICDLCHVIDDLDALEVHDEHYVTVVCFAHTVTEGYGTYAVRNSRSVWDIRDVYYACLCCPAMSMMSATSL